MADITAVPGRLNIAVWAGNTEQVELTWPAGSLDGLGPWTATATVGGTALDLPVAVVDDVQTITLPAETADHLHEVGSWELTDTSSGDVRIAGTFRVTDQAGPPTLTATVQLVDETVTVSVLSDAPVSSVNGETGAVVLDAGDVGADPAGTATAAVAVHGAETVQGDGAHGGPLDAGDVGADPAGSAQAVADDLTTHEAAESVHGWTVTGSDTLWDGNMEVAGSLHVDSIDGVTTGHDARQFMVESMVGDATFVPNGGANNAMAYWLFPATEIRRIKWQWFPWTKGERWTHYRVNFGWIQTGFVSDPVVWEYWEDQLFLTSSGSQNTSPVGNYSLVAQLAPASPPQALGSSWLYTQLVLDRPVAQDPPHLGPLVRSMLVRNGGAESPSTVDAGVMVVTATRTDGP